MQTIELKLPMEAAVAEVLESMCFVSSEGESSEDAEQSQLDWISGELDFTGNLVGSFGIAVPSSTAGTIAANFLGEDEATLSAEQMAEVVCELTNMICGTLLAHLDQKNAFTLSPPRRGCSRWSKAPNSKPSQFTYALDEGFISTWLSIRGEA